MEAQTGIALIAAPAGYGKTALTVEWEARDARPFARVTPGEEHDAHTSAFVVAIEQELDEVAPVAGGRRASSTRTRRGSAAVALARLVRSLRARPPFVLVLDDMHALRSSASAEAVRTLARHVPAGSALALCTRSGPALSTGRLRANRELTEIRAEDLVLSKAESVALFEMSGLDLSAGDADDLAAKAEGWPAGVYLAAVAVGGQPDARAAVTRFGGDDAIVAEYIRDEVLAAVPAESAAFLERASVLDELTGPTCDAVLDRSGSGELLAAIGRDDFLLVPLDRREESYRCHGLLAGMLRGELRRSHPEEETRLHRRASDWYGARADVDRAMHHAVAAGDTARAAGLLASNAPEYVTHARNGTMEHWLDNFTPDEIADQPALALAVANSHLLTGELAPVQRWASVTRRVLHETPPRRRSRELEATVALLHAAVGHAGAESMGRDAARAYELLPEDSSWRPICCLLVGVASHVTGDRDVAETHLLEGVRRGTVAAPNIQTLCLAQLALAAAGRDEREAAAAFSARGMAQIDRYALRTYPTSALVIATAACVDARRGRVEEARRHAQEARRLLDALTGFVPWYEFETRLMLAGASVRLGDAQGARELVASARPFLRQMPDATALHRWLERMAERAEAAATQPVPLTPAELRILAFLPTHLSFREIADRLHVSANTVKTQAHAVYRKLDAGTRSQAVTLATDMGLLDV
jgi:LuxR family maltose regulon positive regulatory protein